MYSNMEIYTGQHKQTSPTIILDLNDDCLLKIFRYFNIEEMACASDSCQRFRDIGCEAFKYEWKEKRVRLCANTSEDRLHSTAILRNFGNQLQKIHICVDNGDGFFEMVVKRCSSSQLTDVDIRSDDFSKKHIQRFKNKFTNLRNLGFGNFHGSDILLKRFHTNFPTVDTLKFFGNPFLNRKVNKLVGLNPQLSSLSLLYRNCILETKRLLASVDKHLPQLERLEIESISHEGYDIAYEPKFFKNLKRLKLNKFESPVNLRYLSISNESVEEMEFEGGCCAIDFICLYKKLKKLTIRHLDFPMDYKDLLKLKELPNLAELEIINLQENVNNDHIIRFAADAKQLVKLFVEDHGMNAIITLGVKGEMGRQVSSDKLKVFECYRFDNKMLIVKPIKNGEVKVDLPSMKPRT